MPCKNLTLLFLKIFPILLILSLRTLTAGSKVDPIRRNDYLHVDKDCDFQLFYSDITSRENYGYARHSTNPITIFRTILQKPFPISPKWVHNIGSAVMSRVGKCKISLLFPPFLKDSNFVLKKWFEVAQSQSLLILEKSKEHSLMWMTCMRNVYIVVVMASLSRSEQEKLFHNERTLYTNIAYAFHSKDKTKFCVVPPVLSRVRCKSIERTRRDSLVMQFKALTSAPEGWILQGFYETTGRVLIATRGKRPAESNPFASGSTLKALVSLARIAFHQANLTILEIRIRGIIPNEAFLSVHQFDRANWMGSPQIVISKFVGYQFLTYYAEQFITFNFYVTPFKLEVWIGLLAAICILLLGSEMSKKFANFGNTSFSAWLFILANIFEENGFVPKSFEKSKFYRLTFGCWGLMALILTNCYIGLMISDLNAPLRGNVPTTFQDLICDKGIRAESYGKAREDNLTTVWFQKHFGNFMQFWVHNDAYDDVLNPIPYGWMFENTGVSKVPRYFKSVLESGIHDRIEKEAQRRRFVHRKPAVEFKFAANFSLGLDSGIVTLFVLCAVVVGAGLCRFLVECRLLLGEKVVRGRKFWIMVCKRVKRVVNLKL
ncbi:Glutamate receptor U1 [Folsomia candida]|uniref:Glutamate receptor U1 n=1 Tax=Folsomia candida TaxID=158441 RepID=A0A226D6U1_FOLCA|nr:Glutamate receptor U1 [Folsomia candida]